MAEGRRKKEEGRCNK